MRLAFPFFVDMLLFHHAVWPLNLWNG